MTVMVKVDVDIDGEEWHGRTLAFIDDMRTDDAVLVLAIIQDHFFDMAHQAADAEQLIPAALDAFVWSAELVTSS